MKLGALAITTAIVAGSAATWTWGFPSSRPDTRSTLEQTPKAVSQPLMQGRLFLAKAQVDQAIASGSLDRPIQSLLRVPGPMHFGDFAWNDRGVPAGPTWIRVDLKSQVISVFRAGHEIGTAVIVYGADNKQTPVGHLRILEKARDHRSSLYDAQMPYTLRLTGDGVSIHASSVRWGAATHGCIGVPPEFAQKLFAVSRVGGEVLIVPGSRAKPKTQSA